MTALPAEGVPAECMAGTFNSHGGVALGVTILGLAAAIYSLSRGFAWLREEAEAKRNRTVPPDRRSAKSWLLGLWVLLPPTWFFVEDIFLYRHFGKAACFESFRYAQELAGKGWAATLAVLTVLYFGKEILGKE
jgi:nicotinamide riboside transporter PnuC